MSSLIELGDVLLQLLLALGMRPDQLEPEPDAGERGAQLVRGVGQQHLVGIDQALDPRRCLVEALRQAGDLVAPFDLHARPQIAGAEQFHTTLQTFKASGEPFHDRPRAERDHERDGPQKGHEREYAGPMPIRHARDQPPPVGERERDVGPAKGSHPFGGSTIALGRRERPTHGRDLFAAAPEHGQIRVDTVRQPIHRLLHLLRWCVGRRNEPGHGLGEDLEALVERWNVADEAPDQAC
jgi:hypothetical protein